MAFIQVRAKVVAFVGGAQRRPEDGLFLIDERDFNPDVFERADSVKPAKQSKQPKAAADDGASVL